MAPRSFPFAFPDLNTEAGAVIAFLLTENRSPESRGYDLATVTQSMQAMKAVVYNRLARSDVYWGVKNPTSVLDIIGAPNQFAGFSRTANGVAIAKGLRDRINLIRDRYNKPNRFQDKYKDFTTSLLNVVQSPVDDPFEDFGGAYGWRTNGSSDPGGLQEPIPSSNGVIQGNKFYTLRGIDYVFVIDTTGSMGDDIVRVKSSASTIIDKAAKSDPNSRFAIVTFKDVGFGQTQTLLAFTKNKDEAKSQINKISVGGGGDDPEGVYSGLRHALLSEENGLGKWRAKPIDRRIILIGDAPAKDENLKAEVEALAKQAKITIESPIPTNPGPNKSRSLALATGTTKTINALADPVRIFAVAIGSDQQALTDFQEIAAATNGEFFTAANADQVVDSVLLAIEASSFETGTASSRINLKSGKAGIRYKGTNRSEQITGTRDNDTLRGAGGRDRVKAGYGNDQLDGGNGNDFITGDGGRDQLLGRNGNDILVGGRGDDVLVGGRGNDTLSGGSGVDLFVFNNLVEASDTVTDFDASADLVDLRMIFAMPEFSGANSFSKFNQLVQIVQIGADTEIRIDIDGNGADTNYTTLMIMKNTFADNITSRNFVIV